MPDLELPGTTRFSLMMSIKTCGECGLVYAIPMALNRWRCPGCADRSYRQVEEWWRNAQKAVEERNRTIAGLRGAFARLRLKKGRGTP